MKLLYPFAYIRRPLLLTLSPIVTMLAVLYSATPQANEVDAKALYQKHCSACHGENGNGKSRASIALNPPPRDFSSAEAWRQLSRERMLISVTYGRPGSAMVGFENRLDKSEIAAIVDYIRTHFMRRPTKMQRSGGAAIYREHCAVCHGDKGAGAQWTRLSLNPSPRDFTAPESRRDLNRERMVTSVTHGRPGTAMMSFKRRLSDPQIAEVVDYIRATFMQAGGPRNLVAASEDVGSAHRPGPDRIQGQHLPVSTQAADMDAVMPFGLQGNPEAGRAFYMENCFTCHGVNGDGKGPRAGFIRPPPRNFHATASRQRFNRPALFRAIAIGKAGTIMPAWSKVLDEQQIANVTEYVFTAYIHPVTADTSTGSKKKP